MNLKTKTGAVWRRVVSVFASLALVASLVPAGGLSGVNYAYASVDNDSNMKFITTGTGFELSSEDGSVSVGVSVSKTALTSEERSGILYRLQQLSLKVENIQDKSAYESKAITPAEGESQDAAVEQTLDSLYKITLVDESGNDAGLDAVFTVNGAVVEHSFSVKLALSDEQKQFLADKTDDNQNKILVYDLNGDTRSDTEATTDSDSEDTSDTPTYLTFPTSTLGTFGVVKQSKASLSIREVTEIYSEQDLRDFAASVNSGISYEGVSVCLKNNIELTSNWTPIGTLSQPFMGTFDGCGYSIKDLNISGTTDLQYVGLFGCVKEATIKSVSVYGQISKPTYSSDYIYVGGVAGYASKSDFINCVNNVNISTNTGKIYVGGIVGELSASKHKMEACINNGDIYAVVTYPDVNLYIGGIAGDAGSPEIASCVNYGSLYLEGGKFTNSDSKTGSSVIRDYCVGDVGGLIGMCYGVTTIKNSINKGSITGDMNFAGGIVGYAMNGNTYIENCYNTANIIEDGDAGRSNCHLCGIVGYTDTGVWLYLTNCYNSGKQEILKSSYYTIHKAELYQYYDHSTFFVENCYDSTSIQASVAQEALYDTGNYKADTLGINGGLPILDWEQAASGSYELTFNVDQTDATIELFKDATMQTTVEGWTNGEDLAAGAYYYRISKDGYLPVTGSVTLLSKDVSIDIELSPVVEVVFEGMPDGATITVESLGDGVKGNGSNASTYLLTAGERYYYEVVAEGYVSKTGTLTVSENGNTIDASLNKLEEFDTAHIVQKGSTITSGGVYFVQNDNTTNVGYITIDTTEQVTLCGSGIASSDMHSELSIKCNKSGSNVVIKDLYIQTNAQVSTGTNSDGISTLWFTGTGNKLDFAGDNLFESMSYADAAVVRVESGTSLTVGDDSTSGVLYMYRTNKGSGFGAGANKACGEMTFAGDTIYIKGSKTGALIGGDAAESVSSADERRLVNGKIVISGGNLNLVNKANGSAIGSSKQGTCAGDVEISGGNVTIITDWQGASIGHGPDGNFGGTLTVTGGSLKTVSTGNRTDGTDDTSGDSSVQAFDATTINAAIANNAAAFVYAPKSNDKTVYLEELSSENSGIYVASANHTMLYDESTLHTRANWVYCEDSSVYMFLSKEKTYIMYDGDSAYTVSWEGEGDAAGFVATPASKTGSSITVLDEGADTFTPTAALLVSKGEGGASEQSATYDVSATDGLDVVVTSSDDDIATASLDGGKLTVVAHKAGIATISLSAGSTTLLEAPTPVTITIAVAEINFKGASLRYSEINGLPSTDYTHTAMRMGYDVVLPQSEGVEVSDVSWGWNYGLSADDLGNFYRKGVNYEGSLSSTFTSNIVFVNVDGANYQTPIYAAMTLSANVGGSELTWTDRTRSRCVENVVTGIEDDMSLSADSPIKVYAAGLRKQISTATSESWTGYF